MSKLLEGLKPLRASIVLILAGLVFIFLGFSEVVQVAPQSGNAPYVRAIGGFLLTIGVLLDVKSSCLLLWLLPFLVGGILFHLPTPSVTLPPTGSKMNRDVFLLLIGEALGIATAIVVALFTYWLQDRRQKQQWKREDWIRQEQKREKELEAIREFHLSNLSRLEQERDEYWKSTGKGIMYLQLPPTPYDSDIGKTRKILGEIRKELELLQDYQEIRERRVRESRAKSAEILDLLLDF